MEVPGSLPKQQGCPLPNWVTGPHPPGYGMENPAALCSVVGWREPCWQAERVLVVSGKRCRDLQHF